MSMVYIIISFPLSDKKWRTINSSLACSLQLHILEFQSLRMMKQLHGAPLLLIIYMMVRGGDGSTSNINWTESYCYGSTTSGFNLQ